MWKTLSSVRYERTVIFTTHVGFSSRPKCCAAANVYQFLDEADLLADNIAILAAPGKLVAQGSPVALKSTFGEGYTVQVSFNSEPKGWHGHPPELLSSIREITPLCHVSSSGPHQASYHLVSKDPKVVVKVLELLDTKGPTHGVQTYDVLGTSIEDIFLDLMNREQTPEMAEVAESHTKSSASSIHSERPMELVSGQKRTPLSQAFTIFHKRALITRRGWLTPFLAVLVAVAGSCIPLFFLPTEEVTCVREFRNVTSVALYLPFSPLSFFNDVLVSPPSAISYLGATGATLSILNVTDNATFIDSIQQTYRNLTMGGVSVDIASGSALVAWEASPPGINGPTMLNLASNILYNAASSTTTASGSSLIAANYASFPATYSRTLVDLKWVAFFAAAMVRIPRSRSSYSDYLQSVYPAFFSLYVSRERRSSVQAMQLSNGLANPVGLWLGHLMFDSLFVLLASTVIVIIFATVSNQFHGLGFFVRPAITSARLL